VLPLHPRLSDSLSCSIWGNHCTSRRCAASNYSKIPTFSAVSMHHRISELCEELWITLRGYLCPQQDASGGPSTSFWWAWAIVLGRWPAGTGRQRQCLPVLRAPPTRGGWPRQRGRDGSQYTSDKRLRFSRAIFVLSPAHWMQRFSCLTLCRRAPFTASGVTAADEASCFGVPMAAGRARLRRDAQLNLRISARLLRNM
jgi:hypothetical protein